MKKKNINTQSDNAFKISLLYPISRFYALPDFDVENPTMNKELVDSFYTVALQLIQDFDLGKDSMFKYHTCNFCANSVKNKDQLIGYLIREKNCPERNDSRYRVGFRSIHLLLRDNLDKIDTFYISEINKMLQPFFNSYNNKESLTTKIEMN